MPGYSHTPIIEEFKDAPPSEAAFGNIADRPYSFFLDSAADHKKLGRYSFLGCEPFLVFKSKRDSVTLEWPDGKAERQRSNPFNALKDIFKRYRPFAEAAGLPFTSGGVGYFAYDMKEFVERLPDTAADDLSLPDCAFGFYDVVMVYDNLERKAYVASSGLPEPEPSKRKDRAAWRLEEFKGKIRSRYRRRYAFSPPRQVTLKSNFSMDSYIKAIGKAKEYIKKGDIYQVNLSQRFEAKLTTEPFELYLRLRRFSPAPFASYLNFGDIIVVSSSPERFLMKRGDHIETRPIKGTRPRGEDASEDLSLERELVTSPKDRAEHVMIVDLERNDLGRICEYGSVRPSEFIILEKYSTVYHLVSTVSGKLKSGVGPIDCLLATFPGGSITGAPKIRAMEIIDELEPVKRSIYTGAVGYISFTGDMDTSIVIRTFVIKGDKAYFQVGGGIVADSDPEGEYYETLDKAKGLARSLGVELPIKDKVFL